MFDQFAMKALVGLVAKLGIDEFRKRGWMPQSYYVHASLQALKRDDLDQAVKNYNLSVEKKRSSERTQVAYEIIECALDIRIAKTQGKLAEIHRALYPSVFSVQYWKNLFSRNCSEVREELRAEEQGYREALEVLENLKSQLKGVSEDEQY